MKCSRVKRQLACLKNDIRQYLVKGLPDNLSSSFNLQDTVARILQVKLAESEPEEIDLLV